MKSRRSKSVLNRRDLLKTAASAAGAMTLGRVARAAEEKPPALAIEAYAGQLSCQAGDNVPLHVSTTAAKYDVEVFRVGAKVEPVFKKTGLPGAVQPVPDDAATHGCRWPVSLQIPVPKEWPSGYYRVMLYTQEENGRRAKGEAFFVVRSTTPGKGSKILLQLATNTYNAYNRWGGESLYGGTKKRITQRVSFERPYGGFEPTERFARLYSGWLKWEQSFVAWAEAAGYAIDFAVNADLEFRPEILKNYRLVLSVGHDEYWSAPMRDSLEAFIAKGGNAAFFSGNTCFWQVRTEPDGSALSSWKADFDKDPVYQQEDKRLLSGMWSNVLVGRPENTLTGVSFTYGGYHKFFEIGGEGCYTVHQPEHWLYEGTGLKEGDKLGAGKKIVGYECDGCQFTLKDGRPVPTYKDGTPQSFQILGSAPAGLSFKGDRSLVWASEALYGKGTKRLLEQPGAAVLGCYTQGGTVVTTGCTEWVRGLEARDPAVERITRNVLDRLIKPA